MYVLIPFQLPVHIRAVGFRRKPFLVKCNGNGGFSFEKIQSKEDALNELSKLKKKKLITKKEFDKAKKELLSNNS